MNKAKNKFSIFLAILVSLCLILPRQVVWSKETTENSLNKIDYDLWEKIQTGDNNSIYTVWILLEEPSYDEAYASTNQLIEKIYGPKESFAGSEEQWKEIFDDLLNGCLIELYETYNKEISTELQLNKSKLIPGYILEPRIDARLTKEDIYRISKNENVVKIFCYDSDYISNNDNYLVINYTAKMTLHILKGLVGLEPIAISLNYDVNYDDEVTIEDALYALEASVKLYSIVWPANKEFIS